MSRLWSAAELEAVLGVARAWDVSGVSIDTRTLQPGDLFVALQGERDGEAFVAQAFAKGAAAALVSRPAAGNILVVADTLAALAALARAARERSRAKILAVTGSVGKTTVKEMLRRGLAGFGAVHAAEASYNNHIGVPLSLARLPREADFGVFEIGMNHPGEIAPLARMVSPHVAIITNVARAHLGLMGSQAAIAAEKATIFYGLSPAGCAVLPADTAFSALLEAAVPAGTRQLRFGYQAGEVRLLALKNAAARADIAASLDDVTVKLSLGAPGMHMALNALAVLGAAAALGLDMRHAAEALDGFAPVAGRGARLELPLAGGTALLLDESYNASDASMRAAFAVLALQPGRHLAVLGDMLELGAFAHEEHLALRPALMESADLVFACGEWTRNLFDSLPASMQGAYAPDAAALAPLVRAALRAGDTVLVKGSYGSRMRTVVTALTESPA